MTPMAGLKGQCVCMKFCFKLCKAVSEALEAKYGFIVMTQKLNNHLQFWGQFPPCPKKKTGMSGQTSQVCSSFFDCDGVVHRVHPDQMDNKHCHQEPLQHLGETFKLFLNMRSAIRCAAMRGTFCKCPVFHEHNIILNFVIFFIMYNWPNFSKSYFWYSDHFKNELERNITVS
jgi:hypothetical protein